MKSTLRGAGAALAGLLTWTALWLTSNAALSAAFPEAYAEDGSTDHTLVLLILLAVSVIASLLAGWVTAKVASEKPMLYVGVLAGLQLMIGLGVQLEYWEAIPLWYHLLFLGLLIPGHAVGGWLARR